MGIYDTQRPPHRSLFAPGRGISYAEGVFLCKAVRYSIFLHVLPIFNFHPIITSFSFYYHLYYYILIYYINDNRDNRKVWKLSGDSDKFHEMFLRKNLKNPLSPFSPLNTLKYRNITDIPPFSPISDDNGRFSV